MFPAEPQSLIDNSKLTDIDTSDLQTCALLRRLVPAKPQSFKYNFIFFKIDITLEFSRGLVTITVQSSHLLSSEKLDTWVKSHSAS